MENGRSHGGGFVVIATKTVVKAVKGGRRKNLMLEQLHTDPRRYIKHMITTTQNTLTHTAEARTKVTLRQNFISSSEKSLKIKDSYTTQDKETQKD